ncbi:hypothetical protein Dimus_003982 [Dionaea muscipula]
MGDGRRAEMMTARSESESREIRDRRAVPRISRRPKLGLTWILILFLVDRCLGVIWLVVVVAGGGGLVVSRRGGVGRRPLADDRRGSWVEVALRCLGSLSRAVVGAFTVAIGSGQLLLAAVVVVVGGCGSSWKPVGGPLGSQLVVERWQEVLGSVSWLVVVLKTVILTM